MFCSSHSSLTRAFLPSLRSRPSPAACISSTADAVWDEFGISAVLILIPIILILNVFFGGNGTPPPVRRAPPAKKPVQGQRATGVRKEGMSAAAQSASAGAAQVGVGEGDDGEARGEAEGGGAGGGGKKGSATIKPPTGAARKAGEGSSGGSPKPSADGAASTGSATGAGAGLRTAKGGEVVRLRKGTEGQLPPSRGYTVTLVLPADSAGRDAKACAKAEDALAALAGQFAAEKRLTFAVVDCRTQAAWGALRGALRGFLLVQPLPPCRSCSVRASASEITPPPSRAHQNSHPPHPPHPFQSLFTAHLAAIPVDGQLSGGGVLLAWKPSRTKIAEIGEIHSEEGRKVPTAPAPATATDTCARWGFACCAAAVVEWAPAFACMFSTCACSLYVNARGTGACGSFPASHSLLYQRRLRRFGLRRCWTESATGARHPPPRCRQRKQAERATRLTTRAGTPAARARAQRRLPLLQTTEAAEKTRTRAGLEEGVRNSKTALLWVGRRSCDDRRQTERPSQRGTDPPPIACRAGRSSRSAAGDHREAAQEPWRNN